MQAKVKKEWLQDLRSGKFEQGVSALKSKKSDGSFKYCCLGVLCERQIGFKKRSRYNNNNQQQKGSKLEGGFGYLTPSAIEKLGLTDNQQREVSYKNDSGYTFEEIADWIEKNL